MTCDPTTLSKLSSCLRCLSDGQLMQIKTYLLCQWFSKVSSGIPGVPSSPDIAAPSTATNIVVTWTNPTPMGAINEIWKSADGITFNLFATVNGNTNQVTDASTLNVGQFAYYKIRSCNGTNCSAFSNTISAVSIYTSPNVASVSFPTLVRAFGLPTSFKADGLAALTSISLPALKRVDGTLDLANNPSLTSVNLNSLQTITGGSLLLGTNNITGALSFPALTTLGLDLQAQSNTLMTSLSAPLLTSVGANFQISGCSALASINFNSLQTVGLVLNGQMVFNNETSLTSFSFPALTTVNNDMDFSGSTVLTSASFPALTHLNPQNFWSMNGSGCTVLASLSIPVLATVTDGFTFTMSACALNAASVNLVLHRGTTWAVVGTDFELGAGTNAAPSGQGVADKATLQGQGNTCNTN